MDVSIDLDLAVSVYWGSFKESYGAPLKGLGG